MSSRTPSKLPRPQPTTTTSLHDPKTIPGGWSPVLGRSRSNGLRESQSRSGLQLHHLRDQLWGRQSTPPDWAWDGRHRSPDLLRTCRLVITEVTRAAEQGSRHHQPLRPDEPVPAHGVTRPCRVLIGEATETRVRQDLVTRQLAVRCITRNKRLSLPVWAGRVDTAEQPTARRCLLPNRENACTTVQKTSLRDPAWRLKAKVSSRFVEVSACLTRHLPPSRSTNLAVARGL